MDVDGVFNAVCHGITFTELTGCAGEQWLNDSCVHVASLRVATEAMMQHWRQATVVDVVYSIYTQLADEEIRNKYLGTKGHVFTKVHTNRIVCCPTYIDVSFPHWCDIIFDMERRSIWKYDPFHRESFLDELESISAQVYMEMMNPELKMETRTFYGWCQQDGHSCGVLVVHWFEQYLSLARTTPP
ncbi:hypothetical protein L914_21382 [Phytophthora nicotianae]|uniref:Ubiquitin-like protease family profile domain-containing protein n=2 Tax=Phytophthora nicotianae TaxID=4792 RepID=W2M610_PHYNI|nr:hypothetical protein L914_21382 [Phytophthora nicotianae]